MKTDNVFVLARRITAALIIIINAFPPQIFRYSLPYYVCMMKYMCILFTFFY